VLTNEGCQQPCLQGRCVSSRGHHRCCSSHNTISTNLTCPGPWPPFWPVYVADDPGTPPAPSPLAGRSKALATARVGEIVRALKQDSSIAQPRKSLSRAMPSGRASCHWRRWRVQSCRVAR
jgi:hypothetical protein